MGLSVVDYLLALPEMLHFIKVPELSTANMFIYRMLTDYGTGYLKMIRFENNQLLILTADYTPNCTSEKVAEVSEEYIEISQFETDSSSFKVGGKKLQQVHKGIFCYVNTQKTTYVYCEKGQPVRFTKVFLTRTYFDTYFQSHYGRNYQESISAQDYILRHPNQPELNFVFQQIRDCQADSQILRMYLEGKVLEMLSLIIKGMSQPQRHIPVKLDYKDIRNLKKTVTLMRNDLAAYPSGEKLAQIAGMSPTRYQLAFKKHYGTTPYEYLKELRLNQALFLLKNSDYSITEIAAKVGYHTSGYFAKLFKNAYGLGPREYRKMHGIK